MIYLWGLNAASMQFIFLNMKCTKFHVSGITLSDAVQLGQSYVQCTNSPQSTETQIAYVHVQIIYLISKPRNLANIKIPISKTTQMSAAEALMRCRK